MDTQTHDLLDGKKETILHLLDVLGRDRKERGALLYQLRDTIDHFVCARDEVCSHGVRAVLGKLCEDVKRENAAVRSGLVHLIGAREDDTRFASALRDLRAAVTRMRPLHDCVASRHAA